MIFRSVRRAALTYLDHREAEDVVAIQEVGDASNCALSGENHKTKLCNQTLKIIQKGDCMLFKYWILEMKIMKVPV